MKQKICKPNYEGVLKYIYGGHSDSRSKRLFERGL